MLANALDHALTRSGQGVEVIKGQMEFLQQEKEGVAASALQLNSTTGGTGEANVTVNGNGSTTREVDGQVVAEYDELMIAYARLIIFMSQIVM